jgi:hypothetical protein
MRTAISILALLGLAQIASAADTAYSALRVIGKAKGESALNQVVEVRGRFGSPEPQVWKVTLREAGARGGVKEFDIQRGKVISERTPVSRGASTPMNFNQLNLDSEGVFTIANQESQKANVVFDRTDYVLRGGTQGGAPVWTVELYERRNGKVGVFEIAADSGAILRKELTVSNRTDVASEDRDFLKDEEGRGRDDEEYDDRDRDRSDDRNFFDRVERHFKRRGRQFENFFTGKGFKAD